MYNSPLKGTGRQITYAGPMNRNRSLLLLFAFLCYALFVFAFKQSSKQSISNLPQQAVGVGSRLVVWNFLNDCDRPSEFAVDDIVDLYSPNARFPARPALTDVVVTAVLCDSAHLRCSPCAATLQMSPAQEEIFNRVTKAEGTSWHLQQRGRIVDGRPVYHSNRPTPQIH
jgi:hypothetical protein